MAGTQRSPTEGGRNGTPVARLLPSPSMDATLDPLDLLTGMFPSASSSSSNPFAAEQPAIDRGDRHQASPTTSTTQVGGGGLLAAELTPRFQNLMYSSNEPLDLLTGLLPPLSPAAAHSPGSPSPTPAAFQQDVWGADILGLGQPPFGSGSSSSIELFGTPEITQNNPFLGNAVASPAFSPPIHPISHQGSDAADLSNRASRSGSMDGSFAKFPPLPDSMASADIRSRSSCSGSEGLSPAATTRLSATNEGSPSTPNSNDNFPAQAADSLLKSEFPLPRRLSSASPGSGFERTQNGPSSSTFQPSIGPPQKTENLRRSISESKHEHWMSSEAGTLSRLSPSLQSESMRRSISESKHEHWMPSEAGTPSRLSPSSQSENLRKSISESKYDQWMPSEGGTSIRLTGKESGTSMSSPRAGTADDGIYNSPARGAIRLEAGTSSRLPGKESGASMSSPKSGTADDEYVGAPGKGIYKPPVRGAVHPRRPVSLELRPHPLRGSPTNDVTLLTCLEGSVWAVCDLGLMVWDIKYATREGSIATGNNPGDEDAAAYEFLKQGSPALCITADVANQVVWTGHRDGKIRIWPARAAPSASRESSTLASLTFQALRHAVTAVLFTPYGELWAGSESGELKAWPWNAVAQALAGVGDCASMLEKNYTDLRIGNIGVGPNGPIDPEVRFLVGDHAHGTVWCAGTQFILIWDARTRERLKIVVGPNGLDLNSVDVGSPGKEILLDEDLKVGGYAKVSNKKDKGGWLQRSRNAVMGAADAVRRAAGGVTQGSEEGRKLEALVVAADGTIWGGYVNGVLSQWNSDGYRMRDVQMRPVGVRSLCVVGNRLWVGYSDGKLHVLDGDTGMAVGSWLAHRLAVVDMAVSGGYVFSLGLSGSIRGWNISSPTGDLDQIMKAKMTNRASAYTRQQHLQVLVGTWNTAQEKASPQSTRLWLPPDLVAEASVVAVGLQEVEMGAGAIGMAAVKETVGIGVDNRSPTGHWWLTLLDNVLGEGKEFERLGSRQLAGMLVGVWILLDESYIKAMKKHHLRVRRKLLPYVGDDIEVGAVACGFGRTLGNKIMHHNLSLQHNQLESSLMACGLIPPDILGAVGVKLTIFRRSICVLTSHLAAHMEHVKNRNADFEHIYTQMSFGRVMLRNVTVVANAAAGVSSAVQNMWRGGNTSRRASITSDQNFIEREAPLKMDSNAGGEDAGLPELADADLLIWTGDLNYRIENPSYEDVVNLINKQQWDALLSKDQLRCEMGSGRTFQGLREGAIRFPPTYKFDKGTTNYDTSEKKRIPAWCDRVLFRDNLGSASDFTDFSSKQGLVRPCKASVVRYEACMEPTESDHKPLRCILSVDLSVTDEADRRYEYGDIMNYDQDVRTCLAKSGLIPETAISTNGLILEDNKPSILRLSNKDGLKSAVYVVQCEGISFPCPCGKHSNADRNIRDDQFPRGSFGFPLWLQVVPAAGVLEPGESVNIIVNVGMRSEDRGKNQPSNVVVVVVNVKGVFSRDYKPYRICVSRVSSGQMLTKDKERPRRRSQDLQRRPSSAESDSQGYGSRQGQGFTKNTATDLLL